MSSEAERRQNNECLKKIQVISDSQIDTDGHRRVVIFLSNFFFFCKEKVIQAVRCCFQKAKKGRGA